MGTIGRSGIPGLLIGNTSETVLQAVNSSVITLKPDDFLSPIR
jgi:universal stress protein E